MALGERLDYADDTLDAAIGVGIFATGNAPATAFDELVRITRGGRDRVLNADRGDRGDLYGTFPALVDGGRWRLVERLEPFHPTARGRAGCRPSNLGLPSRR